MKHFILLGAMAGLLTGCSLFSDSKPQAEAPVVPAAAEATPAPQPEPEAAPSQTATVQRTAARGPSRFSCAGSAQTLTVTYPAAGPSTARIQYGKQTVTATQQRTGSGARYVGAGVDFWERGGTADVTWKGRKLTCKPKR